MARGVCVTAGCEELAAVDDRRCDHHAAQKLASDKARKAKAHGQADVAQWRQLYASVAWRKARRAFLKANPLCVDCGGVGVVKSANEVDHIERHLGDRKMFWDRNNWQALCKPCHSRKTARETFAKSNRD